MAAGILPLNAASRHRLAASSGRQAAFSPQQAEGSGRLAAFSLEQALF
jgi:hypothetical protein